MTEIAVFCQNLCKSNNPQNMHDICMQKVFVDVSFLFIDISCQFINEMLKILIPMLCSENMV